MTTINQLFVPVGMPLHFRLTSTGVMNSFFVPQLGSQIYTMARMITQLSLQADHEGTYAGLSAQFSGQGFAAMQFDVHAVAPDAYSKWIAATKATGPALDQTAYAALVEPGTAAKPMTYNAVAPGLFDAIVNGTAPQPPGITPKKGT